jgi:4-amino-4-deoxy-L-arabinose transferase-like glycosyltransferase
MGKNVCVLLLLAVLALIYVATIRRGHLWGDDFALYISHARNLATGQPYAQTGYIYNPSVVNYSPRSYPPIFPLLLVPSYKLFGLNLLPMKLEEVAFLFAAFVLIYFYFKPDLEFPYLLALIAVLACNPRFWSDKDNVLSDYPFLFFFYLTACLIRFVPRKTARWWAWALLVGFSLYLCVGTRAVGLTLVPGIILYDLVKQRRITAFAAIAIGLCGMLWLLQGYITGAGEASYLNDHSLTFRQVMHNVGAYAKIAGAFWLGSTTNVLSFVVLGIVGVLTAIGLHARLKAGLTVVEILLLPYVIVVIAWPSLLPGLRFLFPLVPVCVFLAMLGLSRLTARLPHRYSLSMLSALLLLVGIGYGTAYVNANYGPILGMDGAATFNELCRTIRDNTSSQARLITSRPRALALYTSRGASPYQTTRDADLWRYIDQIHATHILTSEIFEQDRAFLIPFVQSYSSELPLVYQNADFKLYQVRTYSIPLGAGKPVSRR